MSDVNEKTIDHDLEGVVGCDSDSDEVESTTREGYLKGKAIVAAGGEVLASTPVKEKKKLQHICLTLFDTSESHRKELKRMKTKYDWCGVLEGKEVCPTTERLHLHVYIQTHHRKRKRITEVRNLFMKDSDMWGSVWVREVNSPLEYFRYCKKDGDWNLTGSIFTDSNTKGTRTDRHDLRNAICDEGVCSLKELRYRFPNQMSNAGGENYARQLINDVTPVRAPTPLDSEYLWERELRSRLELKDNGREIITIHSAQTRQGKSVMMKHLEYEYNERREGSCLKITTAKEQDLINTIKDYKHTLELLIIEITKAKGAFTNGLMSMCENIKDGQVFNGKFHTEVVKFAKNVKIIICRNDMHKPGVLFGEDREAYMDMNRDTWQWVPHKALKERWNAANPSDPVIIDDDDYDKDGWFFEMQGKKKRDYGEWFRERSVGRQIEQMKHDLDKDVVNNARRITCLKRKYAGLKILLWIKRRLRPMVEIVEEVVSEPEPVILTGEEVGMAKDLRVVINERCKALHMRHKRAAGVLKRKRNLEEEEAAFVFNRDGANRRQRDF